LICWAIAGGVLLSLKPLVVAESAWSPNPIEIIDTPMAGTVGQYGYYVSFRFVADGNLQVKTAFGLNPRLDLGFGLDAERVIGTEDGRLNKPTLNVKFRLFDGKKALPALALGFDGQGYVWNKTLDDYEQREKGLYLVATKEVLLTDLFLNLGGNIFDFDESNAVRAFFGATYTYEQTVGLLFEYDHATEYKERRINYGLRYYVIPSFTVDAIGRNIPDGFNTSERTTERIVKLNYTGSF